MGIFFFLNLFFFFPNETDFFFFFFLFFSLKLSIDSVAEFLDDLAIDIPKIGDEIAAILLHVYYEGKLSLKFLTEFKFLPTQSQSKQVLATFFKKIDKSKLDEEIVQKNQISLYSILPKNIQEPEVRTAWLKDNVHSHFF